MLSALLLHAETNCLQYRFRLSYSSEGIQQQNFRLNNHFLFASDGTNLPKTNTSPIQDFDSTRCIMLRGGVGKVA